MTATVNGLLTRVVAWAKPSSSASRATTFTCDWSTFRERRQSAARSSGGGRPPTFTDLSVADLGGPRATAFFDTCAREIPFDQLAASVADVFKQQTPAGGVPHWPVVTLLKVVFLQKWTPSPAG